MIPMAAPSRRRRLLLVAAVLAPLGACLESITGSDDEPELEFRSYVARKIDTHHVACSSYDSGCTIDEVELLRDTIGITGTTTRLACRLNVQGGNIDLVSDGTLGTFHPWHLWCTNVGSTVNLGSVSALGTRTGEWSQQGEQITITLDDFQNSGWSEPHPPPYDVILTIEPGVARGDSLFAAVNYRLRFFGDDTTAQRQPRREVNVRAITRYVRFLP